MYLIIVEWGLNSKHISISLGIIIIFFLYIYFFMYYIFFVLFLFFEIQYDSNFDYCNYYILKITSYKVYIAY